MKAVVVGASAGVGRALAEELAAAGYDLLLVATDERDLEIAARSLRTTCGVGVDIIAADLADPGRAVERIVTAARRVDAVLVPAGLSHDADDGRLDAESLRRIVDVNLTSIMAIVSGFLPAFIEDGSGSIVGFGSIAAARGRGRNVAYAAAKRGLRSYFESLGVAVAGTGVEAQLYELGYVETQQTFGKRLLPPPADARAVARVVVSGIGSGSRIRYLPRYWQVLTFGVSLLPSRAFRKLNL